MVYENDTDYENKLLNKLLKQEAALKEKINHARRQGEKRKELIQDNRSKIIGAAIVKEMETNTALKQSLQSVINKHTTNAKDRKSLGLSPLPNLPKNKKSSDQEIQNKILMGTNE